MTSQARYLKPLVEQILRDPLNHSWSVQGFGMMRTYFGPADEPKRFRLNLWDRRFAVQNVSTIHDHPWHFESIIVAGTFANQRFVMSEGSLASLPSTHHYAVIKTGEGGGMEKSPIRNCRMHAAALEVYKAGDEYHQHATEIHKSFYSDGTVTLNERTRVGDGEHARVFWPFGTDWVDAEPRPATEEEVHLATANSLREWFV